MEVVVDIFLLSSKILRPTWMSFFVVILHVARGAYAVNYVMYLWWVWRLGTKEMLSIGKGVNAARPRFMGVRIMQYLIYWRLYSDSLSHLMWNKIELMWDSPALLRLLLVVYILLLLAVMFVSYRDLFQLFWEAPLTNCTKGRFPQVKSLKRAKTKRLLITWDQKFDLIEGHERGHSNSTIGRDVGVSESTVQNIVNRISLL